MQIMTGNKYENIMTQWYESLKKQEKRLKDSTLCQELYGDHEEWVKEDEEKVKKICSDIEDVKKAIKAKGINLDYEKLYKNAKVLG